MRFAMLFICLALFVASVVSAVPGSITNSDASPLDASSAPASLGSSTYSLACAATNAAGQCIKVESAFETKAKAVNKKKTKALSKAYSGRALYHHFEPHYSYCNILISDETLTVAVNTDQFHVDKSSAGVRCGSYLEITSKLTGKKVVARVADITDYSRYGSLEVTVAVARELGTLEEVAAPISWKVVKAPKPKAKVVKTKSKAKKAKANKSTKVKATSAPTVLHFADLTQPISRPPTDARNAAAVAHTLAALGSAPSASGSTRASRPLQLRALALSSSSAAALTKPKVRDVDGCPSCALRFAHMAEGHLDPRDELKKDAVYVLGAFAFVVLAFVGFLLLVAEPSGESRRKRATMV